VAARAAAGVWSDFRVRSLAQAWSHLQGGARDPAVQRQPEAAVRARGVPTASTAKHRPQLACEARKALPCTLQAQVPLPLRTASGGQQAAGSCQLCRDGSGMLVADINSSACAHVVCTTRVAWGTPSCQPSSMCRQPVWQTPAQPASCRLCANCWCVQSAHSVQRPHH